MQVNKVENYNKSARKNWIKNCILLKNIKLSHKAMHYDFTFSFFFKFKVKLYKILLNSNFYVWLRPFILVAKARNSRFSQNLQRIWFHSLQTLFSSP